MIHSNERLATLLRRFLENQCTRAELKELLEMIAHQPDADTIRLVLEEQWSNVSDTEGLPDAQSKLEKMLREARPVPEETDRRDDKGIRTLWPVLNSWSRIAAAATFVLILGAGYYLTVNRSTPEPEISASQTAGDVPPGRDRAVLTLADGREVLLDSSGTGTVARQGNVSILKPDAGLLAYEVNRTTPEQTAVEFNTLSTPRGGQFRVTLPDGTQVWLNAASSLRYPTTFTGDRREVELTGEAYFEVTSRSLVSGGRKIPFIVHVNGMEVEVLGTHFNINAYDNEETMKATLLEGSIAVTAIQYPTKGKERKRADRKLLKPGQQAQIVNTSIPGSIEDGRISVLDEVNTQAVTSWKNGYFLFERSSLPVVMRQLERWYDINVVYEGAVPEQYFGGRIPRDLTVSQVISVLEQSGVKCEIRGRQLVIL